MGRRSKAAARAARYRARQKQPDGELDRHAAQLQALRPNAPKDAVLDYVRLSLALDEELARVPRRSRAIQELVAAKARVGEQLQLHRTTGEGGEMVPAADVARSIRNVLKLRRTRWQAMREEISLLVAAKEDPNGRDRALYMAEIAKLRAEAPDQFGPEEAALSPEALYDHLVATSPRRLPEILLPAEGEEEEPEA